jgi:hypothetical protein
MPMEQKVQADTVGPGDGPVGFAGGDSMSLGVGVLRVSIYSY